MGSLESGWRLVSPRPPRDLAFTSARRPILSLSEAGELKEHCSGRTVFFALAAPLVGSPKPDTAASHFEGPCWSPRWRQPPSKGVRSLAPCRGPNPTVSAKRHSGYSWPLLSAQVTDQQSRKIHEEPNRLVGWETGYCKLLWNDLRGSSPFCDAGVCGPGEGQHAKQRLDFGAQ